MLKKFLSGNKAFIALCIIMLILNSFIYYTYADSENNLDGTVIVIDAGHGGWDPGKVGVNGVLEKDINLQIAEKLKEKLEEAGCTVIMTRTEDTALGGSANGTTKSADMKERIRIMEETKPDYVISIHQNSFSDTNVKGAQVFYHSSSNVSRSLAETLQESIVKYADETNHRKAKTGDDYYILRKSSCPAVIIECGFLSCPEEAEKLSTDDYQNRLAEAILNGIIEEVNKNQL